MAPQPDGSRPDGYAFVVGFVALALLGSLYPLFADLTARPLAVFALPALVTAVVGGWRPTLAVGIVSMVIATAYGVAGPLTGPALATRLVIVAAGIATGAVGAATRGRQAAHLADLGETTELLRAFERSLAPEPHAPPGFTAIVRYQPAEARMRLGGDFLDAITLSERRLGFVIGDVSGHGPTEAALGASIRAAWKSVALNGKADPVEWIEALQVAFFSQGRHDRSFVTLCTGYLDLDQQILRATAAGHDRPVLLTPRPHPLPVPAGPPIGVGFTDAWGSIELPWRGEPLLLYTDGLLENPAIGRPRPHWDEEDLLAWLSRTDATGVRLVDELVAVSAFERRALDDVAVLYLAGADCTGSARA